MLGLLALNFVPGDLDRIIDRCKSLISDHPVEQREPQNRGPQYKILIFPIEDYVVLGTFEPGKSSLKFGYRAAVKECSPRPDFNEHKDVVGKPDLVGVINDYQKRYNVPSTDIYYC